MLMIVIAVLALGTLYAVSIAPPDQRVIVAIVVIGLTAAGYGVGLAITTAGTDQRTYYSIATAIAGTMVAFMWISNKRKSWPKKEARK